MKATLPLFAATLALAPLTHAATVFTNGGFNNSNTGYPSDPGSRFRAASQFTPSSSITFDSLQVEGMYTDKTPGTDQFSVAIFADNGSSIPAALIQSYLPADITSTSTIESGMAQGKYQLYKFALSLPSEISLQAGTYWLSVVNDSTGGTWAWSSSFGQETPIAYSLTSQTSGYRSQGTANFVFTLENTAVPEPSALALGALGLGFLLRRKRK